MAMTAKQLHCERSFLHTQYECIGGAGFNLGTQKLSVLIHVDTINDPGLSKSMGLGAHLGGLPSFPFEIFETPGLIPTQSLLASQLASTITNNPGG